MTTEIHLEDPATPGDGPKLYCDENKILNTCHGKVAAKDVGVGCMLKKNDSAMPLKVLAVTTPAP